MINLIDYLIALTTRATPIKYGGTNTTTTNNIANSLEVYGLTCDTAIPTNSDLNDYTTVGNYYNAGGSTMTLTNSPVTSLAFSLKVSRQYGTESTLIQQRLSVRDDFSIYYRRYNGTSWSTWVNVSLYKYPVGAVYISYDSTSPAELFGGTWTAITGVFPYFNAGTATGGSNTHTLTTTQMPSHTHNVTGGAATSGSAAGLDSRTTFSSTRTVSSAAQATGGGSSHNNMPAYQTLYAWRRTA